jgi:predicted ATP-dependent endonuclease of OLD family
MKLKEIKIKAYKSIINQTINVDYNCMGFIGLNESGKTNVLNAIRYIDIDQKFTISDKSKINNNLPHIEYVFSIKEKHIVEIIDKLNSYLTEITHYENVLDSIKIDSVTLKRELIKEKEYTTKSNIIADFKAEFNINIKKILDDHSIPNDILIVINDAEHPLNTIKYIDESLIPEEFSEFYSDIEIEGKISRILLNLLPYVEFWEYSSKYLIPAEITFDEFIKDSSPQENNSPLYNMFLISNDLEIYDEADIIEKVKEWKIDSGLRRKDSNILSRDINKHIKKIWKDYDQELKVELEENKITIHVHDPKSSVMNFYDMNVRSQGFKTFISFILTISAEVETGILEDYILVLDEPETHLHPSGVKNMKNELLKLASDNNNVFFATHSIFMIDRSNLKRHIIITKEKERTNLLTVSRNNILQEDVIYQALGTSIDDFSVSNENILFEGELDVRIFSFFLDRCLAKKDNKLSDFGFLDGGGTKRILKFFKDKNIPQHSKWTFILDNDAPGRNLPNKIKDVVIEDVYKNMDFVIYSNITDYELEDLLSNDIILDSFNKAKEKIDFEEINPLDLSGNKPKGKLIEEYYGRNKIKGNQRNEFEELFKINLEENVEALLEIISKETTISDRFNMFKLRIPIYFTFISSVLSKFNMNFEAEE